MDKNTQNTEKIYKNLKEKKRKKNKHAQILIFLLAPSILLVTLFILYPVFNTLFYSAYKWNGIGPLIKFRGFENFLMLMKDDIFWRALKNNVFIIIFSLTFQLPIALLLALILNKRNSKGILFFRTIFFLPFILSEIITGVIWKFIYDPLYGLIRYFQSIFFSNVEYNGFLASPDTAFIAILFVIFWKYFGFHMILYIAGLQSIPEEYYEAAKIDGANRRQITWHITIPLLRRAIQMSVFFCIIGSFQVFDVVWAMTEGGPVNSSETLVTYLYRFKGTNLGYGSTIAIVAFAICLVFNLFYQKALRKKEESI